MGLRQARHAPGPPVSIVQCKHWQAGKRVGVDTIRELRGVMAAQNVSRGQFATTSTFTPDAVAFARDNGVNLLDVSGLLALIAKRLTYQQQQLLEVALEGEYWRPTCVNCGIKMSNKTPRKGGTPFWACSNYPRCRATMQMRAPRLGLRSRNAGIACAVASHLSFDGEQHHLELSSPQSRQHQQD